MQAATAWCSRLRLADVLVSDIVVRPFCTGHDWVVAKLLNQPEQAGAMLLGQQVRDEDDGVVQ